MRMTPTDVETIYAALAETIDRVTPEKSELFLAKLALLMAHEINDVDHVRTLIQNAKLGLSD